VFYICADCSIIASRLQVNLDDLLWVLTNSQLKAALTFVGSLRDIVARSTEQSKRLAAEKLRVNKQLYYMLSLIEGHCGALFRIVIVKCRSWWSIILYCYRYVKVLVEHCSILLSLCEGPGGALFHIVIVK